MYMYIYTKEILAPTLHTQHCHGHIPLINSFHTLLSFTKSNQSSTLVPNHLHITFLIDLPYVILGAPLGLLALHQLVRSFLGNLPLSILSITPNHLTHLLAIYVSILLTCNLPSK